MDTFIIKGKPKQTVTLEVDGHSLTFTEGIEIAVFVVVAAQQGFAPDEGYCRCPITKTEAVLAGSLCPKCFRPRR